MAPRRSAIADTKPFVHHRFLVTVQPQCLNVETKITRQEIKKKSIFSSRAALFTANKIKDDEAPNGRGWTPRQIQTLCRQIGKPPSEHWENGERQLSGSSCSVIQWKHIHLAFLSIDKDTQHLVDTCNNLELKDIPNSARQLLRILEERYELTHFPPKIDAVHIPHLAMTNPHNPRATDPHVRKADYSGIVETLNKIRDEAGNRKYKIRWTLEYSKERDATMAILRKYVNQYHGTTGDNEGVRENIGGKLSREALHEFFLFYRMEDNKDYKLEGRRRLPKDLMTKDLAYERFKLLDDLIQDVEIDADLRKAIKAAIQSDDEWPSTKKGLLRKLRNPSSGDESQSDDDDDEETFNMDKGGHHRLSKAHGESRRHNKGCPAKSQKQSRLPNVIGSNKRGDETDVPISPEQERGVDLKHFVDTAKRLSEKLQGETDSGLKKALQDTLSKLQEQLEEYRWGSNALWVENAHSAAKRKTGDAESPCETARKRSRTDPSPHHVGAPRPVVEEGTASPCSGNKNALVPIQKISGTVESAPDSMPPLCPTLKQLTPWMADGSAIAGAMENTSAWLEDADGARRAVAENAPIAHASSSKGEEPADKENTEEGSHQRESEDEDSLESDSSSQDEEFRLTMVETQDEEAALVRTGLAGGTKWKKVVSFGEHHHWTDGEIVGGEKVGGAYRAFHVPHGAENVEYSAETLHLPQNDGKIIEDFHLRRFAKILTVGKGGYKKLKLGFVHPTIRKKCHTFWLSPGDLMHIPPYNKFTLTNTSESEECVLTCVTIGPTEGLRTVWPEKWPKDELGYSSEHE